MTCRSTTSKDHVMDEEHVHGRHKDANGEWLALKNPGEVGPLGC